jgi:hypothetical protein
MASLSIYDPAQCCATGACSPDADDELAQFASSLEWLKERGVEVSRYNLGHQPGAFVQNPMVKVSIETDGIACLPLIVADGKIISKGRYPSRAELGQPFGIGAESAADSAAPNAAAACCGGSTVAMTGLNIKAAATAKSGGCCG